jgi:hypothetical protein
MTSLLQNAFEKAKNLPNHRQNEVGKMMLELMEQDNSNLRLSDAQQAEVSRRLAIKSDLVAETEMNAFFCKLAR